MLISVFFWPLLWLLATAFEFFFSFLPSLVTRLKALCFRNIKLPSGGWQTDGQRGPDYSGEWRWTNSVSLSIGEIARFHAQSSTCRCLIWSHSHLTDSHFLFCCRRELAQGSLPHSYQQGGSLTLNFNAGTGSCRCRWLLTPREQREIKNWQLFPFLPICFGHTVVNLHPLDAPPLFLHIRPSSRRPWEDL